jgi:hypothetical protein
MSRQCWLAHCSEKGLLAEHTDNGFGSFVLFELTASGLLVLVGITFPLLSCFCTVATAHLHKIRVVSFDDLLTFRGRSAFVKLGAVLGRRNFLFILLIYLRIFADFRTPANPNSILTDWLD